MNRNDEFLALKEELEQTPPELEGTVWRAQARARRRRTANWVLRPLGTIAAAFALFVGLVNLSAPFAYAVSGIPVLGDLAAAVDWSGSLSRAVKHGYAQTVGQSRTGDGFTAVVEYLIVDRQQVHIFYSVRPDDPERPFEAVGFQMPNAEGCGLSWEFADSELRHLTADFPQGNVPGHLTLVMEIAPAAPGSVGHEDNEPPKDTLGTAPEPDARPAPEDIQTVTFELELDTEHMEQMDLIPVERWVELDGQRIFVDRLEVSPTTARLILANDPDNGLILTGLNFYLTGDWGRRYELESGITGLFDATGFSYDNRVSSPWFDHPKHLTLRITGAEWLDPENDTVTVDLKSGAAEGLPEGVRYLGQSAEGDSRTLNFEVPLLPSGGAGKLFSSFFTDGAGNEYESTGNSSSSYEDRGIYVESFYLSDDFHGDRAVLTLYQTQWGSFEVPVDVELR